jgi:hypothetical protein
VDSAAEAMDYIRLAFGRAQTASLFA